MWSSNYPSPEPERTAWAPRPTDVTGEAGPLVTGGPNVHARGETEHRRRRTELGLCVSGAVAGVLILGTLVARAAGSSSTSVTVAAVPARPTAQATPPPAAAGAPTSMMLAPVVAPVMATAAAGVQRTATVVPERAGTVGDVAGTGQPFTTTAAGAAVTTTTLGATSVLSTPPLAPTPAVATTVSVGAAGPAKFGASAATPPSSTTLQAGTVAATQVSGSQTTPRTTAPSGATPVSTPPAGRPSASSEGRQASPAAVLGATATAIASSPGQRTHTVRGGDTLLALAMRYRTTLDALVRANNLKTPDAILAIGQTLVLP